MKNVNSDNKNGSTQAKLSLKREKVVLLGVQSGIKTGLGAPTHGHSCRLACLA